MRVLKPETAENRKNKILNWVIHNYVSTGKPVSSELIASGSGLNISSATIRNVLKSLEESGYIEQPHTSGGRVPTDKGYRTYVDNILQLQKLVLSERERIDQEYNNRIEQLDVLMRHTSKTISDLSKCAGFTLFVNTENDAIKRIDFVPMSSKSVLVVLVTHSGAINHFPVILEKAVNIRYLRAFASQINGRLKDIPLKDAPGIIKKELMNQDFNESDDEILKRLVDYFKEVAKEDESVYLEGLSQISQYADKDDFEDFRNIMRVVEERERFSGMLKERLQECSQKHKRLTDQSDRRIVEVTIGSESHIKEFNNFSLVSSSYCVKDKVVGLVGILGHKRMEYPRMISIVDSVSCMVEGMLSQWDDIDFDD